MSNSVKSTPNQDSNEHAADTLQARPANHNGDAPGEIETNDLHVPLDTPHSHLEQNSAPSASSDGSPDSISTSEDNSQDNGRELDKTDNNNLQEEASIHDTLGSLEEGGPGEKHNYESKGEEGEGERGDGDSREVDEHGSVDQAKMAEREVNSYVHVQQLNGQEAVAEQAKGELDDDGNLSEDGELKQEAGVSSQATSEGVENTLKMEDDGNIHEESREEREMNEFGGVDDRKIAESANQEEPKDNLVPSADIDSSSREESERAPSRGEEEREIADPGGGGEESEPDRGEGEREEGGGPSTEEEEEGEEESSDDEMMTFEEFKRKKREEGMYHTMQWEILVKFLLGRFGEFFKGRQI